MASQAARWAADNGETLKALRPDLPEVLNDRQRDSWKPLLQIAEAVSPKFLSAAQKAAVALSETADADEDDLGVMLLRDIATIHAGLINPGDFIATSTLIGALVAVEEAPWATLMRGDKPITGQRLRSLLRRFAVINPGRDSTGKTRGYHWKDFQKGVASLCKHEFKPGERPKYVPAFVGKTMEAAVSKTNAFALANDLGNDANNWPGNKVVISTSLLPNA